MLAVSLCAQTPPSPPPSFQFASPGGALRIPVEIVADGLVFVQAKVNGHSGWFILDNASQGFTIDREYAGRLGLRSSGRATAQGGGANAIDAGIVRDARIDLPGLSLTQRNLVVIALKPIEPAVGHTLDGIIGSRLFDDFVVAVDYEHSWFSVYRPGQYRLSGKETAIPVRIDSHGFPFLRAGIALAGGPPVSGNFLVDGGSNSFADIYKPFADAHGIPPPGMKLLDEPGTSTGGRTESRDGRADRVEVGPYAIANCPVTFAQDAAGLMAAQDYAGLIGAVFLRRFTVVFDSPGKRILLTPNGSYGQPAEYDESGLRIRAEGADFHRFVVSRIVPGSPAAEAGIAPGDVIRSIDDRAAQGLTLTEIRRMLRQSRARRTMAISRGERQLQIAIQLRPLL